MPLDYRVGDGEAETRALAYGLGGEERVEDAREMFGRDAAASVADRYDDPLALATRDNENLAPLARGVRGVDEQVEPDLVELPGVTVHGRQFAVVARELNVAGGVVPRE